MTDDLSQPSPFKVVDSLATNTVAPLTPRERVAAKERESEACDSKMHAHYGWKCAHQLAAELEEANERAQKWAEEAGRYAALTDFWRKRALADERQLIEKDEQIAALEREL